MANKEVEGSQVIVLWYVDDFKVSHASKKVVDEVIKQLEGFFAQLTVTEGSEHTYVGMAITINNKKVEIHNIEYIEETIEPAAVTPAKSHLFEISDDRDALTSKKHRIFHSCVAKLLFIAKGSRPDILAAISFLTTRVTKPNVDDWGKLRRVLKYLKGTLKLRVTLAALFDFHVCVALCGLSPCF